MEERYLRTCALIGEENLNKLKNSTVAVFGIGGVGSFALEALVRSGVGRIFIYDSDKVSKSNINRQLVAYDSTVLQSKVQVAKQRCRDINPDAEIAAFDLFISDKTPLPFEEFDFIVDAVDNVTAKLYLIESAKEKNIPIISVMGTGNKLYPELLEIGDVFDTSGCPLCRIMRSELKKRGIKALDVIWSKETPIKPKTQIDGDTSGKPAVASMAFVPGSAGLLAASFVVRSLCSQKL